MAWLKPPQGGRPRQARRAANRAAGHAPPAPWPTRNSRGPKSRTVLGTSVKRLDGPDKVTGRAKYTFDINRPGHALRAHRALAASARARRLDRSDGGAKAPGVKAALVWRIPPSANNA